MDCNLELGLLPFSTSVSSTSSTFSMGSNNNEESSKPEQMTIFYKGRICVCDVTEFQARNIITDASRKSAERMSRSSSTSRANQIISPTTQRQQIRLNSDHTMKKSLQHFLQKRQHRNQASSPYHRH